MRNPLLASVLSLLLFVVHTHIARAQDTDTWRLAPLFTDHMVLQRDAAAPVWGWARPGESITVTIADQRHTATAADDGRWLVTLDPLEAGGPHELTIRGEGDARIRTLGNVLVGEVWLCSGQSNMQWSVAQSANAEAEIAAANHPQIRLFTVARNVSTTPLTEAQGAWQVCSPQTVKDFSAVGYYFGRKLHEELDVPIGLVDSSWGGTPSEAWTSYAMLARLDEAKPILDRFKKAMERYPEAKAEYEQALKQWQATPRNRPEYHTDPGPTAASDAYPRPDFNDSGWADATLPGLIEDRGRAIDGVFWYRKTIDIPEAWAGRPLTLSLGPIDDFDVTYFNGERIGATEGPLTTAWEIARRYTIPGELAVAGPATIAVRVFDHYGRGGFGGGPEELTLRPADASAGVEPLSLAGAWRLHVEHELSPDAIAGPGGDQQRQRPRAPLGPDHHHSPAGLFNAMINPLIPFKLAGAIWYQGEANAGRAEQYRTIFPAMIRDWRAQWDDNLPFLFVQLANYRAPAINPTDTDWAHLRDAQLHALRRMPNTGMAVAIDIGDANDIHPRNKQDVGQRLARWALADVYDRDIVKSGPLMADYERDGEAMIIEFETFGSPLTVRDGEELRGFTIAGWDRQWRIAQAEILEDGRVRVWHDDVPEPHAVRYAWENNPDEANLVNEEGLPASPFRTDDWPGPTHGRR